MNMWMSGGLSHRTFESSPPLSEEGDYSLRDGLPGKLGQQSMARGEDPFMEITCSY